MTGYHSKNQFLTFLWPIVYVNEGAWPSCPEPVSRVKDENSPEMAAGLWRQVTSISFKILRIIPSTMPSRYVAWCCQLSGGYATLDSLRHAQFWLCLPSWEWEKSSFRAIVSDSVSASGQCSMQHCLDQDIQVWSRASFEEFHSNNAKPKVFSRIVYSQCVSASCSAWP